MSWYGKWNIKYNGKDNDKFVNLAKLIVPFFEINFEETETGMFDSRERISWYCADVDIAKVMEYLDKNDSIYVKIDGDSHPLRRILSSKNGDFAYVDHAPLNEGDYTSIVTDCETGEKVYYKNGAIILDDCDWSEVDPKTGETIYYLNDYYDYEEQTFKKENGSVLLINEHSDEERYRYSDLWVSDIFFDTFLGESDRMDEYLKYISNQFADNDTFIPIVQDFIYDVLDNKLPKRLAEKPRNLSVQLNFDESQTSKVDDIKKHFKTVESTKEYLTYVKETMALDCDEEVKSENTKKR